jgi:inorganic triphosphatase YgiF
MALELEIKLRLPDAATAERFCADPKVVGYMLEPFAETQMESVYYDTPTHALSKRKIALRLRREDGVSIAACKITRSAETPPEAGLYVRDEWQCEADSIEQAVPLLAELGAAELPELIAGEGLRERCVIRFVRRAAVLRLPDRLTCEFAVDRGVIEAGGKTEELLEAELEVLYGEPVHAEALAAEWTEKYGLSYEHASKYERGLRLIRSRQV